MTRLVEFQSSGGKFLVEEDDTAPTGEVRISTGGVLAEQAGETLEDALGKLRPMAETVVSQMQSLALRPDEVSVEFGVKLSAQAGIVLAKAAAEGHLTIKLGWQRGN